MKPFDEINLCSFVPTHGTDRFSVVADNRTVMPHSTDIPRPNQQEPQPVTGENRKALWFDSEVTPTLSILGAPGQRNIQASFDFEDDGTVIFKGTA